MVGTMRVIWTLLLAAAAGCAATPSDTADVNAEPNRHLLIVVDGLRPDYVTPEHMPNLTALGQRGVVYTRHHAVYPTVTRVNASSFSTGAYPERHGLMGNSVFMPRVDATAFLTTSESDVLDRIAAVEGNLLTATTLAEVLQAHDRRMLVVSSGSSGSALLNNHTIAGGAVLHRAVVRPEELRSEMPPLDADAAAAGPRPSFDAHAVDTFLKVGIPRVGPSVTVLWLGALDATAHATGVGNPATLEVLRGVDAEIGRLQEGLAALGLLDQYNIWVTSDHGFSTHTGAPSVDAALAPFVAAGDASEPNVVAGGGAIYVRDDAPDLVPRIVAALQRTAGVGAIFTQAATPGALDGTVPGTLSFDAVRWQHARSAQVLFSSDWTDAANAHGMQGTAAAGGTAGHGSTSPWDVHNTLIAAGPDLQRAVSMNVPSGNVDFAPTFLSLLGIDAPDSMQGRVLREALRQAPGGARGSSAASSDEAGGGAALPDVTTTEHTAATPDGSYSVTATFSTVRDATGQSYRYFDGARVVRQRPDAASAMSSNERKRLAGS